MFIVLHSCSFYIRLVEIYFEEWIDEGFISGYNIEFIEQDKIEKWSWLFQEIIIEIQKDKSYLQLILSPT